MSDNVDLAALAGTCAADDVGGVLFQRVKLAQGADGAATDVSSAAPLQVTLANTGTNATSVVVDLGANNDVTVTSGTITTITNVVHVDDNSSTLSVDDGAGSLTVDVGTALPAGTNAIGKLAANSGIDIGDVDITSVIAGTGATNLGKAEDAAHASGDTGVMALAVRKDTSSTGIGADGDYVPLAVNSTGHAYVAIDSSQLGSLGPALPASCAPVASVNGGCEYETVAASQTGQALGATGASGDYIGGILVIPATTSPGNVLLLDNATSITVFTGGASSVADLKPFYIQLGLVSVSGAWKITTGSNVSCIGMGNFT